MDNQHVKELHEQIGKDWEVFKKDNDAILEGLAEKKGVAELTEKVEKIDTSLAVFTKAKETEDAAHKAFEKRLDEAEAALEQGGPAPKDTEKRAAEHMKLFDSYLRSGNDHGEEAKALTAWQKEENQRLKAEGKAVQTTTGPAGGSALPEEISRDISDQQGLLSPVRDAVKVVPIGTSDYKELVDQHGETSGWINETGTRTEKATAQLLERAPTIGTLYAYPQATEESVDDLFFDVGAWITEHASFEFARQEGVARLTGDGTNKPTGMLNTAPATNDDGASPARSVEALEYTPLNPGVSPPVAAIDPDALTDMVYLLRTHYRVNASWAMNSNTTGVVRKIKQNSEYIWSPGLTAGQPASILGYPVRTWEDLAALAADSLSVLFGDFRHGYLLVDRVGIRITVDTSTTPGYVKWYIRRHEGGIILDSYAIKVGKNSAA